MRETDFNCGVTLMKAILLGTISVAMAALASNAASAQGNPCATGSPAIVRMSELTPTGSVAGFNKAVADHARWYADHGYKDRIFSAPVLQFDPQTKQLSISPSQFMTFHLGSMLVPDIKHDAAWDAYVAEYSANSKITSTTLVCYPG